MGKNVRPTIPMIIFSGFALYIDCISPKYKYRAYTHMQIHLRHTYMHAHPHVKLKGPKNPFITINYIILLYLAHLHDQMHSYKLAQYILINCWMGVPVFFKWMCMRNPKILRDAIQSEPESFDSANPYIDNFYVDMNGLIHPSCNPKGQNIKQPSNFQEQCNNIYEYIDKIMNIVRPKKLLYLAIDGVAPRAKMNQQRSRRFRAAMQGEEIRAKKEELLNEYKKNDIGEERLAQIEAYVYKRSFDSNVITPGTTFLNGVADAIRSYVKDRLANHRLWKNLTVVFSDANCPGEGQHKIMQFIRQERASSSYDPNQTHCIYGADADLIMLGLAAHQPRFFIIREVVITANDKFCSTCHKKGHYFIDCKAAESIQDEAKVAERINAGNIQVAFQFINLKLVREYLHLQFMRARVAFGYDLERIIDDFVFLCFFVGNDFLPHVPCLTIREGGIDMLLKVYEYCLSIMPDYITRSGDLNFKSLKIFVEQMTFYEQDIIGEIINKQSQAKSRDQFNKSRSQSDMKSQATFIDYSDPLNSFKQDLKKITNAQNNLENYSVFSHDLYSYKEKYYRQKFHIKSSEFMQLRHHISTSYLQALSWICRYYYRGVASWSWYYPFHYSPFFSDLQVVEIPQFQLGQPFKPFEQLMAVLPPKTSTALPAHLRHLMTSSDSPIADYFPSEFEIDLTGKKFAWLGEVLLPFIDDKRLLRAMGNYEQLLNSEQRKLNRMGIVNIYFSRKGELGRKILNSGAGRNQIEAQFEHYNIEGTLTLIDRQEDVEEWKFDTPSGRYHEVKLKDGISFTLLEELDEDLIRRADRKAYGGQRFVRIIQRSLGQRAQQLFSAQRNNYPPANRQPRQQRIADERRDRSRDNYRRDGERLEKRPSGEYRGGKYESSDRSRQDRERQGGNREREHRDRDRQRRH